METMGIKIAFLAVYIAMTIVIGVVSMKKVTGVNSFLLGGRNMGAWLSAFAYSTSYFSAVLFIGYAGKSGWGFGLPAVWIGVGNAVLGALAAWLLLAKPTRVMTHRLQVKTMPEFFGVRYGSDAMKIVSACIVFIFLIPYSASVYAGLSYLFESVLHIPYIYCMIFIAVLTALYLTMGGYIATALTDFIQGIIMLAGMAIMVIAIVSQPQVGGFTKIVENLRAVDPGLVSLFGGKNWFALLSLVVLTSIGTWALPQMVHKFYAIKDTRSIKKATAVSTVFCLIISVGAYFIGSLGRLFYTADEFKTVLNGNFDLIIPNILSTSLSTVVISIIMLLVLSASMSTLASIVLTSSSAITIDLVGGYLAKDMSKKRQMLLMRSLCVVFVALSFIIAYKPTGILLLMSFSWGALASAFMGPFIYGLFWKGTTKAGAFSGMLAGLGVLLALMFYFRFDAGLSAQCGLVGMVVSMVVTPVVSLFTKKLPEVHVRRVFTAETEDVAK